MVVKISPLNGSMRRGRDFTQFQGRSERMEGLKRKKEGVGEERMRDY